MARYYRESGAPGRWRVRELGANDGRLAADVLDALARIDPQAMATLEYEICEPLPLLREEQRARLAAFGAQVKIVASTEESSGNDLPGLVFGNEVLDALPFHMVEWRDGGWREKRIGVGPHGELQLILAGEPAAGVRSWLETSICGMPLPDGWQCEVRTGWRAFLESSLRGMIDPLAIWIDYGFLRDEWIQPHRTEGTWRAYRNHRIETDPWNAPGACDLTAHVDFTGVIEAAESLGGRLGEFTPQGTWLTRLALDELAAREGTADPTWTRQFQTLTHPAHLGTKFHVLECTWR
jgi:SAM-dependent MidA family methyltransferase